MSRTPTEPSHDPIFREIDLSAEIRKIWGVRWNSPEVAYRFGDREFVLKTEDAAIYSGVVSGTSRAILDETGAPILDETGEIITEDLFP